MPERLALVSLLVRDYDEAIAFYRDALGFRVVEDTDMGAGKRWVVVAPGYGEGAGLLLARAVGEQRESVGRQAGGRVFLFLHTSDFAADHARMTAPGSSSSKRLGTRRTELSRCSRISTETGSISSNRGRPSFGALTGPSWRLGGRNGLDRQHRRVGGALRPDQ